MAEADVAAWVLLALPPVVFVFIKAVDRWAADQRLRQSVQQRTPSARRGISALERRLELAVADAPASQRGNYRKRLELLMSSAKVNKSRVEGELDKLLAQENTCLGRWLGWCTPGRPSSDLLDLAENSLEADLKAEKDLSDLLATALPSTGAHRVMVERKGPGIFSTGLVEHLNEQLNSHQVLIIRGPAGSGKSRLADELAAYREKQLKR